MTAKGYDLKSLKKFLRPTSEQITLLEGNDDIAPPVAMYITPHHLSSLVYRNRMREAQLSNNVSYSLKLWIEKIESEGGKGFKWEDNSHFGVCWSTKFQLQIMKENSLIACVDSTHKTIKVLRPLE
ncbi:hypothetical protein BGX21_006849, partial [Mortierella sp. AD011]